MMHKGFLIKCLAVTSVILLLSIFTIMNMKIITFSDMMTNPEIKLTVEFQFNKKSCVFDCLSGNTLRCPSSNLTFKAFEGELHSYNNTESSQKRQESFQRVYQKHEWINGGNKINPKYKEIQGSGAGSTLEYAQEIIGLLHLLISDIKRKNKVGKVRLLDIPCGDMIWMDRFLQTRNDVEYSGMDIVPSLIDHHKKKFAQFTNRQFIQQDIVDQPLNQTFDIILCRMMLQHLRTEDAFTVLKHLQQSNSEYILTTTFPGVPTNLNLNISKKGRFRLLNLEIPPFLLEPPICMTRDGDLNRGKHHYLGLWKLPLLVHNSCSVRKFLNPGHAAINFYTCD